MSTKINEQFRSLADFIRANTPDCLSKKESLRILELSRRYMIQAVRVDDNPLAVGDVVHIRDRGTRTYTIEALHDGVARLVATDGDRCYHYAPVGDLTRSEPPAAGRTSEQASFIEYLRKLHPTVCKEALRQINALFDDNGGIRQAKPLVVGDLVRFRHAGKVTYRIAVVHDTNNLVQLDAPDGSRIYAQTQELERVEAVAPEQQRVRAPKPLAVGDVVQLASGSPSFSIWSITDGKADLVRWLDDGADDWDGVPLACLVRAK